MRSNAQQMTAYKKTPGFYNPGVFSDNIILDDVSAYL